MESRQRFLLLVVSRIQRRQSTVEIVMYLPPPGVVGLAAADPPAAGGTVPACEATELDDLGAVSATGSPGPGAEAPAGGKALLTAYDAGFVLSAYTPVSLELGGRGEQEPTRVPPGFPRVNGFVQASGDRLTARQRRHRR
jgi:hypothetical protein